MSRSFNCACLIFRNDRMGWSGFLVFRNIFSLYKCLIIEQPPFYAWRLNSIFYTIASDLSSHASCNILLHVQQFALCFFLPFWDGKLWICSFVPSMRHAWKLKPKERKTFWDFCRNYQQNKGIKPLLLVEMHLFCFKKLLDSFWWYRYQLRMHSSVDECTYLFLKVHLLHSIKTLTCCSALYIIHEVHTFLSGCPK